MTEFDRQVKLLSEQQDMLEMKKDGMKEEKQKMETAQKEIASGKAPLDRKQRNHMIFSLGAAVLKKTGKKELSQQEIESIAEMIGQDCNQPLTQQAEIMKLARFGRAAEDVYRSTTGHGFTDDQLGPHKSFLEFQEKGGYYSRALDGGRSRGGNTVPGSD